MARPSFTHGFPGSAFTPQPDGTLRCPANHPLYPQERRPERDGYLRILYAARIGHCRSCSLSTPCQESSTTLKPRRVGAVLWPLNTSCSDPSLPPDTARTPLSSAPVLWCDWPRCGIRRTWLKVVRSQTICLESSPALSPPLAKAPTENMMTRAERAHWRLSWTERLARTQRSHLEMVCEKSPMNDVLIPLCERYGMNLQTGAGELSITAALNIPRDAQRECIAEQ